MMENATNMFFQKPNARVKYDNQNLCIFKLQYYAWNGS